jgi:hypothetical protein
MKIKNLLLCGLVFMPLACSSTADEPREDYNLLNLLGVDAVDSFYWSGKAVQSQCSNLSDASICLLLPPANAVYAGDNLTILLTNPIELQGQLTAIVAHPYRLVPTPFVFTVQGNMIPGYETGNGLSRILTLTASPNPVTSNGVSASLDQFRADVLKDGLRGTITLSYPGTSTTSVVYSFNIKSL